MSSCGRGQADCASDVGGGMRGSMESTGGGDVPLDRETPKSVTGHFFPSLFISKQKRLIYQSPKIQYFVIGIKGKSPENHPTKGKGLAPALPPVCHAWHQSRVVVSSPSRSRAGLGAAAASGAVFLPARSDLRRARPRSAPAREVGVARHDDREKERELLSGSGALTLAGPAESLANARCLSVWAPAEWNSNCRRLLAAGATVRRWQGKDQGTPRLLRALGGPEGQGWRWCSTRRSRRRRCCEVRTHHQHAR